MDDCTVAVATKANYICDDLVMNILSRLPPKDLVVCKCVSKSWRRLISSLVHSPFVGLFIPFGLYNGPEAIKLFFNEIEVEYSLNFLSCHPYAYLVDCQHGHLLFTIKNSGEQQDYKYVVCNPITGQWLSLPHPPERSVGSGGLKFVRAALVLDEESDSCYSHFKVVRFVTLYENVSFDETISDNTYVEVYSSQIGEWRGSKALMKRFHFIYKPTVHLDGVLFSPVDPHYLLMYDVKEEYCQVLRLPVASGTFECLGKSQGCLHYACNNDSEIKVWMMMVGGDSTREWVLKHSINTADVNFPDPSADEDHPVGKMILQILAFHPNSDAIFIRKGGDFFCYNFNTKAVEMAACYHHPSYPIHLGLGAYPFSYCLRPLVDAQQMT